MGRPRKARFINQHEIAAEFGGMTTKHILRWVQAGKFPMPVKVIETIRLFDREEVERFFRGGRPQPPPSLATSDVSEVLSK